MPDLKNAMHFLLHIQTTKSLEEAFLKGYLMAMGGEEVLRHSIEAINWELMKKNPTRWVDIEKDSVGIALQVAKNSHLEAIALSATYGIQSLRVNLEER